MISLIVIYSGLTKMQSLPVMFIGLITTNSGVVVTHCVIVVLIDLIPTVSGLTVVHIFFDSVSGVIVMTSEVVSTH
jgi:hypothetical protein